MSEKIQNKKEEINVVADTTALTTSVTGGVVIGHLAVHSTLAPAAALVFGVSCAPICAAMMVAGGVVAGGLWIRQRFF